MGVYVAGAAGISLNPAAAGDGQMDLRAGAPDRRSPPGKALGA